MKYDNVYTIHEENSHRFYQVPKELFIDEYYKGMNSDSKLLYSVLLDRKELSRKNNWIDEYGQVYLIYTRSDLAELLGISVRSIQRAFNILKELDLIKEERQGLNKPNKIFICRTRSHDRQGQDNLSHQEAKDWHTSDTDFSETDIKRYTITSNGVGLLNYYNFKYIQTLGKEHPTVTEEQLNFIEQTLYDIQIELDIPDYDIERYIDYHFDNLPKNNDGKIFYFIGDGYMSSPILRYRDYV